MSAPRSDEMAEQAEQTPAETQDTSQEETPAPEEGHAEAPVVDWEQRYNDLRPEFDRKSQQLAEYEAYIEALADGEEPDEDDDDDYDTDDEDDFADPVARQEVARLAAYLQEQQEQEAAEQQFDDESSYIDGQLDSIEKQFEDELSDAESSWIGNFALENRDEQGRPDVQVAYKAFTDMLEGRKQKWVKGKRSSKPASGPGAVEVADLESKQGRIDAINERFKQNEQ